MANGPVLRLAVVDPTSPWRPVSRVVSADVHLVARTNRPLVGQSWTGPLRADSGGKLRREPALSASAYCNLSPASPNHASCQGGSGLG